MRKEQLADRVMSSTTPASSSTAMSPLPSVKPPPSAPPTARPRPQTYSSIVVPPVSDNESWPEITACLGKDVNGKEQESERSKESPPKKAEKTKKWVPIPAEELQAAADALQASSNRRSKAQTGDSSRDRSSTRKSNGPNQQFGNRGPPSQATSASHSRVQSRSGSTHSSPKGVGRRRLPEERRDRDPNSNIASPKINGTRSLGGVDDKGRPLRPTHLTSSARSSKPGSPPAGEIRPQSIPIYPNQQQAQLPLAPSHHYQQHLHPNFQPYGGVHPPPPAGSLHFFTAAAVPPNFQHSTPGSGRGQVNGDRYINGGGSAGNEGVNTRKNAKTGPVQFGTIDVSTLGPDDSVKGATGLPGIDETSRKVLIGVKPNELPALTRGIKNLGVGASAGTTATTTKAAGARSRRSSFAVPVVSDDDEGRGKWEFGSTSSPHQIEGELLGAKLDVVTEDGGLPARLSPLLMSLSMSPGPHLPAGPSQEGGPPGLNLQPQHPPGLPLPLGDRPPPTFSAEGIETGASGAVNTGRNAPTQETTRSAPRSTDADFEVRDYGYGFGRVSGTGRAVELVREEMIAREREREWERNRHAYAQGQVLHPQQQGRVMGWDGGRNERGPRPYESGRDRERDARGGGGVGMRRGGGRGGAGGGGGSGSGSGGPGGRSVRRSNTPQGPGPHGPPPSQTHAPPMHMPFFPPPPGMRPMHAPPGPHDGLPSPSAYYGNPRGGYMGVGPPPSGLVSFLPPPAPAPPLPPHLLPLAAPNPPSTIPPIVSIGSVSGSATVQPPVPVPMTTIPFPLDPTRYYLLGQLEYYLSHENMAQDFFLRQRMDSRGWIPIALIASFNRVRRLTPDINLVREVLYLSSLVQVRDQWVRMGGWERYVLPDAPESVVPEDGEDEVVDVNNGVDLGPDGLVGLVAGLPSVPGAGIGGTPMYLMHEGVPMGVGSLQGGDDGYGTTRYDAPSMPDPYPSGSNINGISMPRGVKGEMLRYEIDDGEEDEDDVVFVMGKGTS